MLVLGIIMTFWRTRATEVQWHLSWRQAKWSLSHKLELNKENHHHLDLEELWLYLPSAGHPRHTPVLGNMLSITPTSTKCTFIPISLLKLQICTSNSQLLIHKSMPHPRLRVTHAKTQHTSEFHVTITQHHSLYLNTLGSDPGNSLSQKVVVHCLGFSWSLKQRVHVVPSPA